MGQCLVRVMGAAPPWGQSLLRSCLAPHSFPPPPPAYVLSALGTVVALVALTPKGVGVVAVDHHLELRRQVSVRKLVGPHLAKPHQAGVGAGRSAERGTSAATTGPRGAQPP